MVLFPIIWVSFCFVKKLLKRVKEDDATHKGGNYGIF